MVYSFLLSSSPPKIFKDPIFLLPKKKPISPKMSPTTTTYGTIASSSIPNSTSSRAKHTRRPWPELCSSLTSFALPSSSSDAKARIKLNIAYFRVNYVIVMLTIIFLTLLWHPTSMIVFLLTFIFWWFFYFFNNNPIVIFNKMVDDNVVLGVLSLATVILLVLTHVGINVLVGLIIGVVVVGVHAAFRVTEDLGFRGEEEEENGLLSVVGSQPLRPTSGYNRI